jgi:TonB family protein
MKRGAMVWLRSGFVIALVAAPNARQEQARPPVASPDDQVYQPGNGVSWPQLIKQVDPKYTDAAQAAKIEGTVTVKGVIEPNGHTDRVTVLKSLDKTFGLDEEAVKAASQWVFVPATKSGKRVAVWVQITMEFRLPAQVGTVDDADVVSLEISVFKGKVWCRGPEAETGLVLGDFSISIDKMVYGPSKVREHPKQPGRYLLEFNPPDKYRDGSTHQIEITVQDRGPVTYSITIPKRGYSAGTWNLTASCKTQ